MSHPSPTRRRLIALAKLALGCAILAFLLTEAQRHAGISRLLTETKNWPLLIAAVVCVLVSEAISFLRWHLIIRAVGIETRLSQTVWLGSIGFVLNFVSLGSLGGDLFKAVFLARDHPGQRTAAVATVVADRVLGMLLMFVLASGAILASNLTDGASAAVVMLCQATIALTVIGCVGVSILFLPGVSGERMCRLVDRIPLVGGTLARLLLAVRSLRQHAGMLLASFGLCLLVDALFIVSFYLVARGLPVHAPTLVEHFVIVPLAVAAGAIPITPNGLGTLEAAVEALYMAVPSGVGSVVPGDGTIVTLAHRMVMISVAVVFLAYFLFRRTNLRETLHEAEGIEDLGALPKMA